MDPLQSLMDEAREKMEEGAFSEALESYRQARRHAADPETYLLIGNTIGQLHEWMGHAREAADQYRDDLRWIETQAPGRPELRALSLNNLGRGLLSTNAREALECFDGACSAYRELADSNPSFRLPLANTLLARGEAYAQRKKFWYAKKDYKEAIEFHKSLNSDQSDALMAHARYQLGNIYAEEYNGYDARIQYFKAREIYEMLLDTDRSRYLPLLAAVNNNLALVQRDLEEYDPALKLFEETLEAYRELAQHKPQVFEPYLANTHTSTGILLAEQFRDFKQALQHNWEALQLYESLCQRFPDRYDHYLATAHHNAGVYQSEAGQWEEAEAAFNRALKARYALDRKQPGAFREDVCATALNLLELYRHRLDTTGDWKYRDLGMSLADTTSQFLKAVKDTPATQTMKTDLELLRSYFETVEPRNIQLQASMEKIRRWEEEIDSTLDLNEKRHYQQRVLNELKGLDQAGEKLPWLQQSLARALNNMAWLELCIGATQRARKMLQQAGQFDPGLLAVRCNTAHCDLLEGRPDSANRIYRELWPEKDASGTGFGEIINKDLVQLISLGVLEAHHLPKAPGPGEVPTVV